MKSFWEIFARRLRLFLWYAVVLYCIEVFWRGDPPISTAISIVILYTLLALVMSVIIWRIQQAKKPQDGDRD